MILHCHWWEFWSRDTDVLITLLIVSIKNEKLLNSNNNGSKSEIFRLLWDIVVFKLVAYLLNMIYLELKTLHQILHIYMFWYRFDKVLYQFLETGTSDRTLASINP